LIEANFYPCYADCPVIPLPNFYEYCFREDSKFIIAEHQSWAIGVRKLASLQGRTFPVRYDDGHVWVRLPSGWEMKLNQEYHEASFRDKNCRDAAQMRSFEHGYTRPGPVPGEPAEPVMHGKLVYGWTICSRYLNEHLVELDGLLSCTVWDLKGDIRQKGAYRQVDLSNSPSKSTAWNETTDGVFRVLHLRDGRTLKLSEFTQESPLPSIENLTQR